MKIKINLSLILLIVLMYISNNIVFADVDMEEGLYARYNFEIFNWVTAIYDTQNNAERLLEFGPPTAHYSNVKGIGKYVYFDGDDYYVDAGGNGILSGTGSQQVPQLTICAVVRAEYPNDAVAFFTVSEYGRDGFYFDWRVTNNKTYMSLRDSVGTIQAYWGQIETNTTGWTLLTYSYKSGDDGHMRMWHNTTNILNFTGAVITPQMENRFAIGRQQWNGYYAKGSVGFLEIYTQSIDDDWITEKYNSVFGIDVNVTSEWVDMSDMLFEELLFGSGFWFGVLLVIAILQVVSSIVPGFSSLGGIFSFLLFIAYIMNMDLNGWHVFGIMLMAVNGVYLFIQSSE